MGIIFKILMGLALSVYGMPDGLNSGQVVDTAAQDVRLTPIDSHREVSPAVIKEQRFVFDVTHDQAWQIDGNTHVVGNLRIGITRNFDLKPLHQGDFTFGPNFTIKSIYGQPSHLNMALAVVSEVEINLDVAVAFIAISVAELNVSTLAFKEAAMASFGQIGGAHSFIGSAPGFAKSRIDQPNTDHAQDHAGDGGDTHDRGPQGGGLLRYEVVILSLFIACFLFGCALCIRQAPRLLYAGNNLAGLASLFIGVTGIFVGLIVGYLLISPLL